MENAARNWQDKPTDQFFDSYRTRILDHAYSHIFFGYDHPNPNPWDRGTIARYDDTLPRSIRGPMTGGCQGMHQMFTPKKAADDFQNMSRKQPFPFGLCTPLESLEIRLACWVPVGASHCDRQATTEEDEEDTKLLEIAPHVHVVKPYALYLACPVPACHGAPIFKLLSRSQFNSSGSRISEHPLAPEDVVVSCVLMHHCTQFSSSGTTGEAETTCSNIDAHHVRPLQTSSIRRGARTLYSRCIYVMGDRADLAILALLHHVARYGQCKKRVCFYDTSSNLFSMQGGQKVTRKKMCARKDT